MLLWYMNTLTLCPCTQSKATASSKSTNKQHIKNGSIRRRVGQSGTDHGLRGEVGLRPAITTTPPLAHGSIRTMNGQIRREVDRGGAAHLLNPRMVIRIEPNALSRASLTMAVAAAASTGSNRSYPSFLAAGRSRGDRFFFLVPRGSDGRDQPR